MRAGLFAREKGMRAPLLAKNTASKSAPGFGPMAGKALRIGLMGHSASIRNVDLVLAALADLLK